MAKHGIHVGRTTSNGKVIEYNKGRYTIRCNCGVLLYDWNAEQASKHVLACRECWLQHQSEMGKRGRGWPQRWRDKRAGLKPEPSA